MTRRRLQDHKRVQVFPKTGPLRQRPRCQTLHIETWYEMDRAHVAVYDEDNEVVSEWWDEEVHQAFDRGVFVEGKGFEDSVVAYLGKVGVCRRPGALAGRRGR